MGIAVMRDGKMKRDARGFEMAVMHNDEVQQDWELHE